MSNLIEKDALKRKHCDTCVCKSSCMGEGCKIYEARCLIADLPTIENDSIDKAEILRLCNEIEDISCNISNQSMNYVVYADAQMIISKAGEIVKELTGDARTD